MIPTQAQVALSRRVARLMDCTVIAYASTKLRQELVEEVAKAKDFDSLPRMFRAMIELAEKSLEKHSDKAKSEG